MSETLYDQTKKVIRSVLISNGTRTKINELKKLYYELEGKDIAFARFGYRNLYDFLNSMPDAVQIKRSETETYIYPLAHSGNAHILKMVKETRSKSSKGLQRNDNSNRPSSSRTNRNEHFQRPSMLQNIPGKTNTDRLQQRNGFSFDLWPDSTSQQFSNQRRNQQYQSVDDDDGLLPTPPTGHYPIYPSLPSKFDSKFNRRENNHHYRPKNHRPFQQSDQRLSSSADSFNKKRPEKERATIQENPEISKTSANQSNDNRSERNTSEDIIDEFSYQMEKLRRNKALELTKMHKITEAFASTSVSNSSPGNSIKNAKIEQAANGLNNNKIENIENNRQLANADAKYPPADIDSIFKERRTTIVIAEINSPYKFWFNTTSQYEELTKIMADIGSIYNDTNEYQMPPSEMRPGRICAAKLNDIWHRAEFISPPNKDTVKINFVDYGTCIDVNVAHIKYLFETFADVPIQSVRGCLTDIQPVSDRWTLQSTRKFANMVQDKCLFADFQDYDTDRKMMCMKLIDTNNEHDVVYNDHLVELGLAKYCD